MPHSLDQDEFRAGNGLSRRSPAANVACAISKAVDHEAGYREMPEAFGPITGGHRRERLASGSYRIVGAVVGAAVDATISFSSLGYKGERMARTARSLC